MTRTMKAPSQQQPQHSESVQTLLNMLGYRRPAWSRTEKRFIKAFLDPLDLHRDAFGNLYKRIGAAPVLWSCHTDTVHTAGGAQLLQLTGTVVSTADPNSNCLGADDTAGLWLMTEMIRANRPGLYIFHRAEEIGGRGSDYIANDTPELLAGIKYAIAFDRRGTASIITHQAGGRCCSGAFADSLSDALQLGHYPDAGGTFTDTANYTGLIGECTNVSVGYMLAHTKRECLDIGYLIKLRDALIPLDTSALVSSRQPGAVDAEDESWFYRWPEEDQEPRGRSSHSMAGLLRAHPEEVADWLEEYGITTDEIETAIYLRGGVVRR